MGNISHIKKSEIVKLRTMLGILRDIRIPHMGQINMFFESRINKGMFCIEDESLSYCIKEQIKIIDFILSNIEDMVIRGLYYLENPQDDDAA